MCLNKQDVLYQGGELSCIKISHTPIMETENFLPKYAVNAIKLWQPRLGEIYTVVDSQGNYYRARLIALDQDSGAIIPFYIFPKPVESSIEINICQALPERHRFELILQKLTELGVSKITPFISKRSATLGQLDKKQKRSHKWFDILLKASKQSRRAMIPELSKVLSWDTMLQQIRLSDLIMVLNEKESKQSIKQILRYKKYKTISIIIGPEGGITSKEIDSISALGGYSVSMGMRILRTETASIMAAGIMQYEFETL